MHTLTVSDTVFRLLDEAAQQAQVSPSQLAERLLQRQLATEADWPVAFERLIQRVHSRMTRFDPSEIEADISAASAEVKAERRARRSD
jgi:hypothetical protein